MSKKKTKDSTEGKSITTVLVPNMDPPRLSSVAIAAFMSEIGDYFLWDTSLAPLENTTLASEAIQAYWNEGGYLNLVVTGIPEDRQQSVGISSAFAHRVFFKDKQVHKQYLFLLRQAKFLFHPTVDTENFSTVLQAALFQVPTLASSVAVNESTSAIRHKLHFFRENELAHMVEALHFMEKHYPDESSFNTAYTHSRR